MIVQCIKLVSYFLFFFLQSNKMSIEYWNWSTISWVKSEDKIPISKARKKKIKLLHHVIFQYDPKKSK